MTAEQADDLARARASLARQRDALAKRIAAIDLAPMSMAEDLARTLLAIEAVDRALTNAARPSSEPGMHQTA